MPIGIIANVLSVIAGGLIGAALQDRLPENYRTNLTCYSAPRPWEWASPASC